MKLRLTFLALLGMILLVACGGGTKTITSTTTVTSATTAPAPGPQVKNPPQLACSKAHFYMQCVGPVTPQLTAPPADKPPPGAQQHPQASNGSRGVDFAWGGPPCGVLHTHSLSFGISYLSNSSKDWTPGLIASYRHGGCPIGFVWETAAARAFGVFNDGYNDAYRAHGEASRLGAPPGSTIFAAVDTDTTPFPGAIVHYFQGWKSALTRLGFKPGAYGGLATMRILCQDRLIVHGWETVAWSFGTWASTSCAQLRQTSINGFVGGFSIDPDVQVAADAGLWGGQPRIVCFGPHAVGNATCRRVHKQVAGWERAQASSLRAFRARGCPAVRQRRDYFDRQLRLHPRTKVAYRKGALRATRRHYSGLHCPTYDQRYNYFGRRIAATKRQYS